MSSRLLLLVCTSELFALHVADCEGVDIMMVDCAVERVDIGIGDDVALFCSLDAVVVGSGCCGR